MGQAKEDRSTDPMAQLPIDAVLAGTKNFAVALLAPLTVRLGTRPRVAADPGQVLGLCSGPSALAIVEFTGEGSLSAIQAMVRDGRGIRVVAGLPSTQAGAEGTLRALGVEVARWDGKVDGVVGAVERVLSGSPAVGGAEAPLAAARPLPSPAPAAPGSPPVAPRVTPSPVPASRAAVAPPGPVGKAARPQAGPGAPPGPLGPAARPLAAPGAPGAAGVRPAGPPVAPRPSAPVAATPSAGRAVPGPPVLRPAAVPVAAPVLARPKTPPPAPAAEVAAPVASPGAAPVAAPPARPTPGFFADLEGVSVDTADLEATAPPSHPAPGGAPERLASVYMPPPLVPRIDWPATISSAAEAEDALLAALKGTALPSRPLHVLALRTLETLSDLERAVLSGEPQPVDAAPVRKAAMMRLRVADALGSVPPAGSPVDTAALSTTLGEIDALLSEVAPILSAAPEELKPALEAIRNALVSEAIDFSEAAQRVAGSGAAAPAKVAPRPAQARLLSVDVLERDEPGRGRQVWMAVLLAASVLLAAVYHGLHWYHRYQARRPVPGLPAGMVEHGAPGGPRMVMPQSTDRVVDPAEVAKFKAAEEAKGNIVIDTGGGPLFITPAPPHGPPKPQGGQ